MEVPRFAAVVLSLMLAANCFMPCYTLAYADDSQEVADVPQEEQEEIAGGAGGLEFSSGGVESNADAADGGAAAEGHGADDGAAAGAGEAASEADEVGVTDLSPDAIENLGLSDAPLYSARAASVGEVTITVWSDLLASIESVVGGSWSSTADAVSQFWGWFPGSTNEKISKATSASSLGIYGVVSQMQYWLRALRSLNLDMRNYQTTYLPMVETMRNLLQSQWGYNYGGTAIIQKSSPAWYLQLSANRLNYNGSLVGSDPDDYSAARLLARIHNSQYGNITYTETGNTGTRSTIGVLGYVANLLYQNNLYSESATTRLHYVGGLVGEDGSGDYSAARLLARIHNSQYGIVTYAETGGTAVRSTVGILGYLSNLTYYNGLKLNEIRSLEKYQGSLNGSSVDDVYGTARLLARLFNMNYQEVTYAETGTTAYRSTAGILGYIANLTYYNGGKIDTFSNMTSKGFSDVLDKLGSLSVSVEVDFSGVESRLDSIIRLLTVAGVVENAKDVLDAIFGDMSLDVTDAAASAVGSAIQNAFPFCVPAVLKQILGLLQADPAPPEFHFDFWGAPLDFGFSDWQGLADMTSWLSRIGFAVMLFANSRRFVYSGGVAGD